MKRKKYLKEKKKTKMFTRKMMNLRRDAINDIKFHKFYPKCTFTIEDIAIINLKEEN